MPTPRYQHAGSNYSSEDLRKQAKSFAAGPQPCDDCKARRKAVEIPPNNAKTLGSFMPPNHWPVSDNWYKATGTPRPE